VKPNRFATLVAPDSTARALDAASQLAISIQLADNMQAKPVCIPVIGECLPRCTSSKPPHTGLYHLSNTCDGDPHQRARQPTPLRTRPDLSAWEARGKRHVRVKGSSMVNHDNGHGITDC